MRKTAGLAEVSLTSVRESPLNIRSSYREETLVELGKSLAAMGMIQPVVVQLEKGGVYELVAGTRRFRGAKREGISQIPAVVVSGLDDKAKILLALSENLHREDLTPFEEAAAISKLVTDYGMGLNEVAKAMGRPESYVRRRIQLLSVPREVQELVSRRELGVVHAEVIAYVKDRQDQVRFSKLATKGRLTPSELATEIKRQSHQAPSRSPSISRLSGQKIALRLRAVSNWLGEAVNQAIQAPQKEMLGVKDELEILRRGVLKSITKIDKELSSRSKK